MEDFKRKFQQWKYDEHFSSVRIKNIEDVYQERLRFAKAVSNQSLALIGKKWVSDIMLIIYIEHNLNILRFKNFQERFNLRILNTALEKFAVINKTVKEYMINSVYGIDEAEHNDFVDFLEKSYHQLESWIRESNQKIFEK